MLKSSRLYPMMLAIVFTLVIIFASPVDASAHALPSLNEEPREVALYIEDESTEVEPTEVKLDDEIPAANEVVEVPLKGIRLIHREFRRFTLYFYTLFVNTNEAETPMWISTIIVSIFLCCSFLICIGMRVLGDIIVALIAEAFRFGSACFTAKYTKHVARSVDGKNNSDSDAASQ